MQGIIKIKRFNLATDCAVGAMFDEKNELFALTLELPWKDNQSKISCIPKGEYICLLKLSPHFGIPVWEVQNVPLRTNIEIHPANQVSELLGCIAPGHDLSLMKGADQVLNSRPAFEDLMFRTQNFQQLKLVIEEV